MGSGIHDLGLADRTGPPSRAAALQAARRLAAGRDGCAERKGTEEKKVDGEEQAQADDCDGEHGRTSARCWGREREEEGAARGCDVGAETQTVGEKTCSGG
jgi:hypothetical protein